jgi:hypothetical protein
LSEAPCAPSLFDRIRTRCAEVARRAQHVRIDTPGLEALADRLAGEAGPPASLDPAREARGSDAETVAFVLTLDTINFGSGWFPHLRKRPGCSGYLTIAAALREHFDRHGPWSAAELEGLAAADVARLLDQPMQPPVDELMALYARALAELGGLLRERYAGRYEGPIEQAEGCAERLVRSLAAMPLYRDVERYQELEVPFYKRAQIAVSDLAIALAGEGLGRFRDLARLTLFADNLVPHVLRMEGVLRYAPALAERIAREEPIPLGSPEEVEIRAAALHAVERLVEGCRGHGLALCAHELDHLLWDRGQSPEIKAVPRHRTRCTFY